MADIAHNNVAVARDRQDRAALAAKVHAARLRLEDAVPALLHAHRLCTHACRTVVVVIISVSMQEE